jgi:hypothetical protein
MRIDLGAKVKTQDGHDAGEVKQAIWDPRGSQITQFVVSTGGLLGHDVIVSPELLESAARDGGAIVIGMSKQELDELAHYEPSAYAPPPADWRAPSVHGFPSGGFLFPVSEVETAPVDDAPATAGQSRGPAVKKST